MLSELVAIHQELRTAIAELGAVVERPTLDAESVARARLRVTRASRRRRSLIECEVYPLLHDISPYDASRIADLRLDNAASLIESSEHISRWTITAIAEDWPGYQRASARMRATMLQRIAAEGAVLYPLLKARASQAA